MYTTCFKPALRGRLAGVAAVLLMGALSSACEGPPATEGERDGVSEVSQPLYGGTVTTRMGVVIVSRPGLQGTGVMISPHMVLTAAHLVRGYTGRTGNFTILYKFPNGNTQIVGDGTSLNVIQFPGFNAGDAAKDLAVIVNDGTWTGTRTTDYAKIYYDTMSAYSRLQLYGYGVNGFGGGGAWVLRTGSMGVDWYGSGHFILNAQAVRACAGDSGGPVTVGEGTTGFEMHVAGLTSNIEATTSGYCSQSGPNVRVTRLSDKVGWIIQNTGYFGVIEKSQKTGRSLVRFFDYSLLKRTVMSCTTRQPLSPEQTIDLSTGYSNYKCGDRYQEQCIDDGSADTYYIDNCM